MGSSSFPDHVSWYKSRVSEYSAGWAHPRSQTMCPGISLGLVSTVAKQGSDIVGDECSLHLSAFSIVLSSVWPYLLQVSVDPATGG